MKIKEIIVVEGKSDTQKIRAAVEADTIETNGSAIDQATLEQIHHAQKVRGVIVLTDPDFAGEKIRKTIMQAVPEAKHAFISREEGRPKGEGSLGIEHASLASIRKALKNVVSPVHSAIPHTFDQALLHQYGLIAGTKSRSRREKLGNELKIGYTNAKQLKKRLAMFEISVESFEASMKKVLKEEKEHE